MEVENPAYRDNMLYIDTSIEVPNKPWPVHKKPHPLKKCRAFNKQSLDEWKDYLKENNICLIYCASSGHQARHCKAENKCSKCGSEKHRPGPAHAGPAQWKTDTVSPAFAHGSEEDKMLDSPITTYMCTQVCGNEAEGCSCTKIYLVNIYPRDPELKIKTYEIMARSFFDTFNISINNVAPYTPKTCAGVSETTGK